LRSNPIIILASGIFILIAMLFVIVFGDNGWLDLRTLKLERDQLVEQKTALFQENVTLFRQIDRLKHDPQYNEVMARRELGMIEENEIILKLNLPKEKRHVKR
jgi:cell division protein FtsB